MLVMTIIGEDRPGLVESVARLVTEHGGNWLESRMSRLGGQFAGILRVEVPGEKEPALAAALEGLGTQGLTVVIHRDQPASLASGARLSRLEIVGHDRPGIVSQISRALASYKVNVEELQTECASAPMTGEPLFIAKARIRIPETVDVAALRQMLEKIAADLIVEISFAAVETQ